MKVVIPVLMVVLSLAPVLGAGESRVFADRCVFQSIAAACNHPFSVEGRWDPESGDWSYSLNSLKTGKTQNGTLPLIGRHAHLYFFLSDDGKRFAVLDATAGHHLTNRLMTYTSDGKLLSSLGVRDLLTPSEQAGIIYSSAHLHWLKKDDEARFSDELVAQEGDSVIRLRPSNPYGKYNSQKNTIAFTTLAGRKVSVALADGKVVKRVETNPKGSEEE